MMVCDIHVTQCTCVKVCKANVLQNPCELISKEESIFNHLRIISFLSASTQLFDLIMDDGGLLFIDLKLTSIHSL